jgi:hypothetical protein
MIAVYIQALVKGESTLAPPKEGLSDSTVVIPRYLGVDDLTKRSKTKDGEERTQRFEAGYSTHILSELDEWPEVIEITKKLNRGERLTEKDELWINELAETIGWDKNAIINELTNISADPSKRVEKYKELHEEYFKDAKKFKKEGDTRQAGEKLWGAVTALIKLYAANKNIPVMSWSRGKLERFITNNVEEKYKRLFRDLLDKTQIFHEHFYEAHLDNKTFEERWEEAVRLLEKARELIIKITQEDSQK